MAHLLMLPPKYAGSSTFQEDSLDNQQRAAHARDALDYFAKQAGDEWADDMERLTDLLANLMHFCKQNAEREDCPMDFEDALYTARMHFEAEL
jgi:hypothetical protein